MQHPQKEENNRPKSVHYQLRAQCESQQVSVVTSKETRISCSQRKDRDENQAQDFIYELQRRLNSQPQQVSSARDWKGKEWGSEAWMWHLSRCSWEPKAPRFTITTLDSRTGPSPLLEKSASHYLETMQRLHWRQMSYTTILVLLEICSFLPLSILGQKLGSSFPQRASEPG